MSTPVNLSHNSFVAWLLVAVLLSLVVSLAAAVLKVKDGANATATIRSAAIAFAGSMTLCVPIFQMADLL